MWHYARLAIVATATLEQPDGESCWSQAMIVRHLRERGLEVSRATVGRALADAAVRLHRVRDWLNRAGDPQFWHRAGQVCRLCLDPPPGTVLVSINEKTGVQAKTRIRPDIPRRPRPGRSPRVRVQTARHRSPTGGRRSAALDAGHVSGHRGRIRRRNHPFGIDNNRSRAACASCNRFPVPK
jgi:hypothetical protein